MLPFDEFVPYAPKHPGAIRKDHNEQCTGNSKALRIVRKDDGSISARCFRCGQWGKWSPNYIKQERKFQRLQELFATTEPEIKTPDLIMPTGVTLDPRQFGLLALQWLNRYGIRGNEILRYKIGFHTKFNRVFLPVYEEGKLKFYQYRKLVDDGYPKYISKKDMDWALRGFYIATHPTRIVVCEDILSAIKCGRFVSAFALLGTSLSEKAELLLASYEHVFIYLDNDSSQVKQTQSALKRNLSIYGGNVHIIKQSLDPKEIDVNQLHTLLLGGASVV